MTGRSREVLLFGPYRLYCFERRLERHGQPVPLSSRALDILIALVERAGEVVEKRDLMARAWPNMVVDESNLRVHIASLRKRLDDPETGFSPVSNVPGRGYCFIGRVERAAAAALYPASPRPLAPASAATIATTATTLDRWPGLSALPTIGRDDAVRTIAAALPVHRFVSIVGPGGIGKTTVAMAVAQAMRGEFGDATSLFDLGLVADAHAAMDALAQIGACRPQRPTLIVMDTCEHVLGAVAPLAEQLVSGSPYVHLVATSREALRAKGEHVFRLPGLAVPPGGMRLSHVTALAFPAMQLFRQAAAAGGNDACWNAQEVEYVADICRRLDGHPLAIELAAGRVATFGIEGTARWLDSPSLLYWQGRRTAIPRHRTLGAGIDWSYGLLSETECRVLRDVSAFAGKFDLESALVVLCRHPCEGPLVAQALDSLVAKSLLAVVHEAGGTIRYAMSEPVRVYAWHKRQEQLAMADAQVRA